MKINIKLLLYLILLTAFMIVSFPFEMEISPLRKYTIINKDHNPIMGALVKHSYSQYCVGFHGETEGKTDKDGKIFFVKKSIRTNLIVIIYGAIKEFINTGIHASYGTYERTIIFADGYKQKLIYNSNDFDSGLDLESGEIILEK